MIYALVGQQNCGKTTLFNVLTGSNQHVGNFPGVTVDQKAGYLRGRKNQLVDLPGIYSIRSYSTEEKVTRDFILDSKPDGIINVIEATNIERNLYLTLQLLTLRIPTVIALNMMDEVAANGWSIDIQKLSEQLGVPVVPISAAKNQGLSELVDRIADVAKNKILPSVLDFCPEGPIHRCIHGVMHIVEDHAQILGYNRRFCAIRLIEGDSDFADRLGIDQNEKEMIEHSVVEMESETGLERNEAIAEMRYDFIEAICSVSVSKKTENRGYIRSQKLDRLFTGRYTAIPACQIVMGLVFFLTFNVIGGSLQRLTERGIAFIASRIDYGLGNYGLNPVVKSLVVNGIFGGVGSVLSFLPVIVVLFFFLSILEDSGYMARVAFVMDKLLRKIGLSGKSFVPMLLGFGCTVPAVMATRTLPSERDRKFTILLTPFMSCSAKVPIYAFFSAAFFPGHGALAMTCIYFSGIIIGILVALLLKNVKGLSGNPVPFMMELPNYRMPGMKNVGLLLWDKAKDFITRAFTVIFVSTVVIWFLQTFDSRLNVVEHNADSLLASLGRFVSPIFRPMDYGDWRIATSLISGLIAKEAVVSTMRILLGGAGLGTLFSLRSAVSCLAFILLYTPCVAAIAAMKRELGSVKAAAGTVIFQCLIAWLVSFIVYLVCGFFL
ncbi:MAG: ferrous iron transport protein B [Sphaerochaetaceae bacterium]|nr:ferrous iron transport protein B [Sphaerochaetaceae bacterium]